MSSLINYWSRTRSLEETLEQKETELKSLYKKYDALVVKAKKCDVDSEAMWQEWNKKYKDLQKVLESLKEKNKTLSSNSSSQSTLLIALNQKKAALEKEITEIKARYAELPDAAKCKKNLTQAEAQVIKQAIAVSKCEKKVICNLKQLQKRRTNLKSQHSSIKRALKTLKNQGDGRNLRRITRFELSLKKLDKLIDENETNIQNCVKSQANLDDFILKKQKKYEKKLAELEALKQKK